MVADAESAAMGIGKSARNTCSWNCPAVCKRGHGTQGEIVSEEFKDWLGAEAGCRAGKHQVLAWRAIARHVIILVGCGISRYCTTLPGLV